MELTSTVTPEPKLDRTDSTLNIQPFAWPTTLDATSLGTLLAESQTSSRNLANAYTAIAEAGEQAEKAVHENMLATLGDTLDTMGDSARQSILAKTLADADRASKDAREAKTAVYAGVNQINSDRLAETQRQLDGLLAVMPNSASMLDVLSSISPPDRQERMQWESLLKDAGYATTRNMVARAISTGDRRLAAACLSRLQQLGKGERPITPGELADRFVGPLHKQLVLARDEVSNLRLNVVTLERKTLTGKGTNYDRLKAGLRTNALDHQRSRTEPLPSVIVDGQ